MSHCHIPLADFFEEPSPEKIFRVVGSPAFSPLDFNLKFLNRNGWSVSFDRFRFHVQQEKPGDDAPDLVKQMASHPPHLLLRRLNKEEDYFVAISVFINGRIEALGNDNEVLLRYLEGIFTEFPPSYKEVADLSIESEEITEEVLIARFVGMLYGAYGWDPMHDLPPPLEESLQEAQSSLAIGNYRSCVVMCRRALEALLKFAHERILGKRPVNKKGKELTLNDLIVVFRTAKAIPQHLLFAADSLRSLGNVPGAHAADIKDYHFTKYDAEFALSTLVYFNEQYFTKVDKNIRTYYTLTIEPK